MRITSSTFSIPAFTFPVQKPAWKSKIFDIFYASISLPKIIPFFKTETALSLDPKLIIKKLDNGLTYYVRKNDHPLPQKAYLRLVIKTGWLNETPQEKGIAHLVEHITQIQTENFSHGEIRAYLNTKGVGWGTDSNAHTAPQETTYKLDIPLDDPATLEKCLYILSEVGTKAHLSDAIIDHERDIVIDELTQNRNGWTRYHNAKRDILCEGTPYENIVDRDREIESVRTCPPEVVRGFYKRWYHPENMAVIAVGDFNEKSTCALIEKYFGKIPASSYPPSEHDIKLKSKPDTQVFCFNDPEITFSYIEILHMLPKKAHQTNSSNSVKKSMMVTLFKSILNSRLRDIEEEENSSLIQTTCVRNEIIPSYPHFTLGAITKEGEIAKGLNRLLLEIKRIKEHGILASELDHFKEIFLAKVMHKIEEKEQIASTVFVADCHDHFVDGDLPIDEDSILQVQKRLIDKITLKEMNALTAELLPETSRLISAAEPQKANLQMISEDVLREELMKAAQIVVQKPTDDIVNQKIMHKLPRAGKIESTKYHKRADVTEYTLQNGMKVFFKPTTLKNDEVLMRAQRVGGTIDADVNKLASAKFGNDLYFAIGIGDVDLKTLNKIMNRKNVSLSANVSSYSSTLESSSVPKNLESAFQLFHLMFTNPGYDEGAFNRAKAKAKEFLRNQQNNPNTQFAHQALATITQDHPSFRPITIDNIDQVNYENCKDFHKNQFSNPADFNISIVGNIQRQKVKKFVERYFATLPKIAEKRINFDFPAVPFPSGITRKEIHAGKETSCTSLITFPSPIEDILRERMLSEWCCDLLKQRLNEALRFEIGKTYTQSCSFANTSVPGINPGNPSNATIVLTGDAANLPVLEKALLEQIQILQKEGPTDLEVNNYKKHSARKYADARKINSYWRDALLLKALWNRQQDDFDDYDKELETFSASEAKEHFNKIFRLDNYAVVTLLPEKHSFMHEVGV